LAQCHYFLKYGNFIKSTNLFVRKLLLEEAATMGADDEVGTTAGLGATEVVADAADDTLGRADEIRPAARAIRDTPELLESLAASDDGGCSRGLWSRLSLPSSADWRCADSRFSGLSSDWSSLKEIHQFIT
jgi:hypothetical protein